MNSTHKESSKKTEKTSKIVEVIELINEKIDYLIDCSAKDFITLNNNFVQYHNDIDNRTSHLDAILELFSEKIKVLSPLVISDITLNIQNIVKKIDKKIARIITVTKDIEKNLNYILLPINNAKQDISTLRLINTNLKFDPELKNLHVQMNDTLLNLLNCFENIENKIVALKNNIEAHSTTVERKSKKLLTTIQSTVQHYNHLYDFLMDKRAEAEEYRPLVDELKSKKTASSSQIITNLQYQDIIRQKIEHVKQAQDKILSDIIDSKKSKKGNPDNEKDVYRHLLQDIGTLQVAQLVHANQKYQNAIDTIIEKFKELDKNLNKITEISRNIRKIEDFDDKTLKEKNIFTNKAKRYFNDFDKLIETFFINVDNSYSQSKLLTEEYNKLNCIKIALEFLSEKLENLSKHKIQQKNSANSLNQFTNILTDVYANTRRMEDLLELNHKNIKKISDKKISIDILNASKQAASLFSELSTYFENFIDKNENVLKLLDDNEVEYPSENNTNFSIENVKYYKMFETEVENIIHQINALTSELNIGNTGTKGQKNDLDFLKKLYSMRSERIVHELVTGEKKEMDEETTGEDEGSLELF